MYTETNAKEAKKMIMGKAGQIEALIAGFSGASNPKTVGIICHPHPLYLGTMNNKVVTTVVRTWQQLGFATIRFNFRGVGESEGQYDHGIGELQDLLSVLDWVKRESPTSEIWLAGFSFGAFIALQAAISERAVVGLLSIAPALPLFDFTVLPMPSCPWLIIQGDADELIGSEMVNGWYQSLPKSARSARSERCELIWVPGASHFFHGQLLEIKHAILSFINPSSSLP